jgi:hypothetical protein
MDDGCPVVAIAHLTLGSGELITYWLIKKITN